MIRRFTGGAVLAAAVLGGPAGYAYGATASPSCSDGDLATANLSGTPTSVKAGAAVVDSTRLTNTTAVTLSNASFILALLPPPGVHSGTGTPQLSWRVDGGSWHSFGLSWSAPSGSAADWQSQVQYVGASFASKASHTLDIRTEFTTATPSGEYQYDLAYSADPCGMQELGMNFEDSSYAQGWTQPKPSPTTHKPTTPNPTHAAPHTPAAATTPAHPRTTAAVAVAAVTTSPSASPSRSAATIPADSATPLPATKDAASSSRQHRTSVLYIALPAALLLLGGGLYAGRRSRRAKAADSVDR